MLERGSPAGLIVDKNATMIIRTAVRNDICHRKNLFLIDANAWPETYESSDATHLRCLCQQRNDICDMPLHFMGFKGPFRFQQHSHPAME